MKARIDKLIRDAVFWWWCVKATWRLVNGRYFVWRDAPQWVIEYLTSEGPPTPEVKRYDELLDLYNQAQDELRRRRHVAFVNDTLRFIHEDLMR